MTPSEKSTLHPVDAPRRWEILVADDVEEITDLMCRWLEAGGYAVTRASGGREVIEWVQKRRFDIVVTDIVMPGVDGWDAILAVGRIRPETRILAISGGSKQTPVDACLRVAKGVGADLVLKKPFRRPEFVAAVKHLSPKHEKIG
jgi:two-component system chemotaxis response regulator CheY